MNSLLRLLVETTSKRDDADSMFRLIVQRMNDPVLVQRSDGSIVYANPACTALFGFSESEFLTIPDLLRRSVHPDYKERHEKFWHEYRETGQIPDQPTEGAWVRRDGKTVFTESVFTLLQDRQGRSAGLLTIARDITARKSAQRALFESELRYHELFNSMLNGYGHYQVIFDENGAPKDYRYLDLNPAFEKITGRNRLALIGKTAGEVYGAVDPRAVEMFGRVATTGRPEHVVQEVKHLNLTVEAFVYSPRPGECVAIFSDAGERIKVEAQLQEKHRRVLDQLNDGVFVVNLDGIMTYANQAMARITGRASPEDLVGKLFLDHVAPEKRDPIWSIFQAMVREQAMPAVVPNILIRPDGSRTDVEVKPVPLVEAGRIVGVCGVIRDVSQQKLLERQLIHAQKMEAVGRLAGGVAHDFNNILTTILGYTQLIRSDLREGDPLAKDILEIENAGERAARLTRQLLAFSRKQVLQPRVLTLTAVVTETKKMLGRLIGENIELVTKFAEDEGAVKADPGQIEQVLMNLAVNSRDAMPKGGRLTIATANVELTEEDARRFNDVAAGRYVLLTVSDTGCGMTPEVLSHLFEPFFTTKEAGKGTGLGLSTVYGIVKQSEGHISVQSEPGVGTTFHIYLPRIEQALDHEEAVPAGLSAGQGETVLVAEDDWALRLLVARTLETRGYRVLTAEDAEQAGMMAQGEKGPIHLLLTDVVMHGMMGPDLAEQVQGHRPETRVLLMSGYTAAGIFKQSNGQEKYPFILKPFTPDQLARKVAEVLV